MQQQLNAQVNERNPAIANALALLAVAGLVFFWWGLYSALPRQSGAELDLSIVGYSMIGGIVPPLLWLWFWLKEDALKPEPRGLILLAFLSGMVAVAFSIPLEQAAQTLFKDSLLVVFLWAFIEEFMKFLGVYLVAFKSKFFDEPIDAMIYLITAALGFAALENSLYLMSSIVEGGVFLGALNAHLRFLGATLLHVVSSGAIGIAIAFSFYRPRRRAEYLTMGVAAATALHALFNLFIIEAQDVLQTLIVFSYYWLVVIVLILLFEKVKQIRKPLSTLTGEHHVR